MALKLLLSLACQLLCAAVDSGCHVEGPCSLWSLWAPANVRPHNCVLLFRQRLRSEVWQWPGSSLDSRRCGQGPTPIPHPAAGYSARTPCISLHGCRVWLCAHCTQSCVRLIILWWLNAPAAQHPRCAVAKPSWARYVAPACSWVARAYADELLGPVKCSLHLRARLFITEAGCMSTSRHAGGGMVGLACLWACISNSGV
jgi:hypothetical protein